MKVLFVDAEQTEPGPEIVVTGPWLIVTVFVQVELQPEPHVPVVVVRVKV